MPTYQFLNKNTNEIEEHRFSYTKLDEFKEQNPHLERFFSAENLPILSDGVRMNVPGTGRPDGVFEREIIGRIKDKVPGNTLGKSHKTNAPREW